MADLFFQDLTKETTATTGTGTVSLAGAVSGYRAIPAGADGRTIPYKLVSGSDVEIGRGVYTHSGRTLSRVTVEYSTAGGTTKITLAGTSDVWLGVPSSWLANVYQQGGDTDVAVADGGTGAGTAEGARANLELARSFIPQGRLTLTTATPVLTADVSGATTVYYTPHVGNQLPLWNGSVFVPTVFSELSLALDSDSGHTGYHQSGKNFDLFVFEGGSIKLGTGPAWTNDTTRADAISRTNGVLVNNGSIVIRWGASGGDTTTVSAGRAILVGTMRASANGQVTCRFGGATTQVGGMWFLWNLYNRVRVPLRVHDATDSWPYTTATIRQKNGNAGNKIEVVNGEAGYSIDLTENAASAQSGAVNRVAAIGYDSTSAIATGCFPGLLQATAVATMPARLTHQTGLGYHYYAELEYSAASGTTTWYGDAGLAYFQTGMTGIWEA